MPYGVDTNAIMSAGQPTVQQMNPLDVAMKAMSMREMQQNMQMRNQEMQQQAALMRDQQELQRAYQVPDNVDPDTGMLKPNAANSISNPQMKQKIIQGYNEAKYQLEQRKNLQSKEAIQANKLRMEQEKEMREKAQTTYDTVLSATGDKSAAEQAFMEAQADGIKGLKSNGVFPEAYKFRVMKPEENANSLRTYKERQEFIEKANKAPEGYRKTKDGNLEYIPGGPADPKAGKSGEKAPSGFRFTADGNLEFIPGGPADPSKKEGKLGAREAVFVTRTLNSANEAARDLENVVNLPLTSSSGWFGGRKQGEGILAAGKETLANKMTSQEAQSYNTLSSGFQRSLAAIEAAGLAPSGTLSHQMDAVIFKEGDTNLTKLQKLAQTRQIIEAGLETTLSNPRLPDPEKELAEKVIKSIQKSVPFTQNDLLTLERKQEENPETTLADVMKEKKAAMEKEKAAENPKVVKFESNDAAKKIKADYQSGKITRDQAREMLSKLGQ